MADENKPTDKVDLASAELKIGGVNLKGSYIVWFLACVSAVGGGIYAAGGEWGKYQKLQEAVSGWKNPDMEPVVKLVEQVSQQETAITNLSQSLADTQKDLMAAQKELMSIKTLVDSNDVSKLQGAIATLKTSVEGVSTFTRDVQDLRVKLTGMEKDMSVMKKDVDKQWDAIDSIGAGSLKGK
jgi:prophage DNA circulation protein